MAFLHHSKRLRTVVAFYLMVGMVLVIPSSSAVAVPQLCNGRPATVVGTAGDDLLKGTESDDVIVGLAGNDRMVGLGGNDTMCGRDGDDVLVYPDENRDEVRERLCFLRQQRAKAAGRANRCLADYVAPDDTGAASASA